MRVIRRQPLIATLFPASMLEKVRHRSLGQTASNSEELVILTGEHQIMRQLVRLIAQECAREGKTIRVIRSLPS
jgi:hypothetical protein